MFVREREMHVFIERERQRADIETESFFKLTLN